MGNFIRALLLISTSCTNMNLIQHINVISFVLFYSLSMTSASGYNRQAEWVSIGGKNYDFNPAAQTQSEARARCIRLGGKLFEPKDATTNRDVFVQAGAKLIGGNNLWIGVSDVGTEDSFTYLSDGTLVNFVCESSAGGKAGCWLTNADMTNQPTPEATTADLDCVVGNSAQDGQWSVIACTATGAGKFGSICEMMEETPTSTSAPATPPPASGSTSLKSGIAVFIGTLLLLS